MLTSSNSHYAGLSVHYYRCPARCTWKTRASAVGCPTQLCERKIITNASLAIEARLPLTLNNHTITPRATPRTVRLRPPGVELEGYRIYGTPWQPAFFGTVRGSTRAGKTGSAVLAAPLCCHPLPHDVAARHISHEACVNTAKHEANEANAT